MKGNRYHPISLVNLPMRLKTIFGLFLFTLSVSACRTEITEAPETTTWAQQVAQPDIQFKIPPGAKTETDQGPDFSVTRIVIGTDQLFGFYEGNHPSVDKMNNRIRLNGCSGTEERIEHSNGTVSRDLLLHRKNGGSEFIHIFYADLAASNAELADKSISTFRLFETP